MDFDTQKMEELLELTRENNKILRSMRSAQRWHSFLRLVYWMVIFGSVFGTYYYFQPTIQKYVKSIQTSVGILQNLQNAAGAVPSDIQTVKNLMGR